MTCLQASCLSYSVLNAVYIWKFAILWMTPDQIERNCIALNAILRNYTDRSCLLYLGQYVDKIRKKAALLSLFQKFFLLKIIVRINASCQSLPFCNLSFINCFQFITLCSQIIKCNNKLDLCTKTPL